MELSEIFWKVIVRIGQLIPRIVWTLSLVPNPLATLKIHLSRSFKHVLYQESVAGSVIQARDSKDNELWEFNRYFSKIADLPPKILSEISKNRIKTQNAYNLIK